MSTENDDDEAGGRGRHPCFTHTKTEMIYCGIKKETFWNFNKTSILCFEISFGYFYFSTVSFSLLINLSPDRTFG